MTHFIKAFIIGSALFAATGAASAEDNFEAAVTYNPSAPVEAIYATFEAATKAACANEARSYGVQSRSRVAKFMRTCQRQLMHRAVSETRNDILIALHDERTSPRSARRMFTSLR